MTNHGPANRVQRYKYGYDTWFQKWLEGPYTLDHPWQYGLKSSDDVFMRNLKIPTRETNTWWFETTRWWWWQNIHAGPFSGLYCITFHIVWYCKWVSVSQAMYMVLTFEQAPSLPDLGETQMDEVWPNKLFPHPRHVPSLPGQPHHLRGHQPQPHPVTPVLQLHLLLPTQQHDQPVRHRPCHPLWEVGACQWCFPDCADWDCLT